jgi:hypothetical protein
MVLGMAPSKINGLNSCHGRHPREQECAYPQLMTNLYWLLSSIAGALASCVLHWKIKKTAGHMAAKEIRTLPNNILRR